jgi:hypothetical protein
MRQSRIRLAALASGLAALVAGAALADLAKWDQARATGIAGELVKAADGFEQAVRDLPDATVGSGSAEASERLVKSSRQIHEQARALSGHLSAGRGQAETVDEYKNLKEASDDAADAARMTMLPEPVMDAWAKLADLMRQIAPYYDPKALTEPKP